MPVTADCWLDAKAGARSLRATPLITACALSSIGLGMWATVTMFVVLNGLALKHLPVQSPNELIVVVSGTTTDPVAVPLSVWKEVRKRNLFDKGFAWAQERFDLAANGQSDFVETLWVTGGYFETLGLRPDRGHFFGDEDDRSGGGAEGPVVVISHSFFERRFAGRDEAVGTPLYIRGIPFRIVGVMPEEFRGVDITKRLDLVLPIHAEPLVRQTFEPWVQMMGRLSAGQSPASLTLRMATEQSQIRAATMPPDFGEEDRNAYLKERWTARRAPTGISDVRNGYASAILILLATAGAVMLIATANVAMLMLVKASGRRREIIIKQALGAPRLRLVRQTLLENLLVTAGGSTVALVLAWWTASVLAEQMSNSINPVVVDFTPDWRVLLFTASVALLAACLASVGPYLQTARGTHATALRQTSHTVTNRFAAGDWLVGLQLAASLVLVVLTILFTKSFATLESRDLGFVRRGVWTATLALDSTSQNLAQRRDIIDRLAGSASAVPSVRFAALSLSTPAASAGVRQVADVRMPHTDGRARILKVPVGPGWFATYGTHILAGRDFSTADRPGAPEVAIVNHAFVQKYLEGKEPIGTLIPIEQRGSNSSLQIVGVAQDAAFTSVRAPIEPTIYTALAQTLTPSLLAAIPSVSLSVRVDEALPDKLAAQLTAAVIQVEPSLSVRFRSLDEQLNALYVRERLLAGISLLFGCVGASLAAVGAYGVAAYAVSRRRKEMALRMTLGASPRSVSLLLLRRSIAVNAGALLLGSVFSVVAARSVRPLLFGVESTDTWSVLGGVSILGGIALAAALAPSWRLGGTNPANVIREP